MINRTYKAMESLSMDIDYKVYRNHESTTPIQTENGTLKKKGDLYYYQIGSLVTIKASSYNLIVDNDAKTIALLNVEKGRDMAKDILLAISDSLLRNIKSISFAKINNTQNAYILTSPNSEYAKIKIFFNVKSFFIEKLELYYKIPENFEDEESLDKEAPRVEISYHDINTRPAFPSDLFTYANFLRKEKNKYYCKEKYQGYHLIEQMKPATISCNKDN